MSIYTIHEDNMPRLVKKLKVIENKCVKHNCSFKFEEVGEAFKDQTIDDRTVTQRYVLVDVEGEYKIADWEFIGTIDHTEEGNIVRVINTGVFLPPRYYVAEPVCEHCHSRHKRVKTFIVRNVTSGEFKQVGSSCLAGYTHGLNAEAVARYLSYFDELAKFDKQPSTGSTGFAREYIQIVPFLSLVSQCVKKYGYHNSYSQIPTSRRAVSLYHGEDVDPDIDTEKAVKEAEEIISWVKSTEDDETKQNEYFLNLRVACRRLYVSNNHTGLVASAVIAYTKEQERKANEAKRAEEAAKSEHIGNIGDKIEFDVAEAKILTSVETQFGYTNLIQFKDMKGNIYTWWTSTFVDIDHIIKIKGTVKGHDTYKGIKQTQLTRCRQAVRPKE